MMRSVLVVAALALATGAAAEEATPLTFEQALARALERNLTLSRVREEVTAAQGQKRAMLSLVLPKLQASGSFTRNSDEVAFGSGPDAVTILPHNDWSLRLSLAQPIFAGNREKKVYEQSKAALASAQAAVIGAEDAALLRVAGDYLGAVQGDVLMGVEQQNLALAEKRLVHAGNLFDAGETTRVDVLRAQTAVKAAQRRVLAARQQRDAAYGRLRVSLVLDGEVSLTEPQSVVPAPPEEAELALLAADRRADLRQAAQAVRIASLEVGKQWGAYLPVVTADAGYIRQKVMFPKAEYGFGALRVSVPLFQGGEVGAKVAAARARKRQAELALEETRRVVREDVHLAGLGLDAARTNLALAQEQLAAADEEYTQAFERYRNQEATTLDVEAAETSLAEARRAVVTGRVELRLAELGTWAVAGSLKTALFQEVR